jgi:DNA anti-recombination protein RmuC
MPNQPNNPSISRLLWVSALCASTWACQRTAEGVKQDTQAATSAASQTAEDARRSLEGEVSAFKTETDAKLEQLSLALAQLEARAETGLDASKQKLKDEIGETRAKLGALKADSRTELQQAKSDLSQRVSEMGQQINSTLKKVGDKVEDTFDD